MSQPPHEIINLRDVAVAGNGTGFPTPKDPAPGEESNLADGSGPLFNMYLGMAEEEDNRMTNSWKSDADGILVFTGLFSASVAALVAVSVQDLRPNSQDTSAFYLQNIYQVLSDPDRANPTIPSTLAIPPPFSPPKHAVWVNSLWILSLAISLTCGLQATLLQQWARRYKNITHSRKSPSMRARIRAFFFEGVQNLHLPWAVEALPALLHLSLFLFFAGLLIFLFNINHTVFSVVAWWIGICSATYVGITLMPLFRRDSPYYAPLSLPTWYLVGGTLYIFYKSLGLLFEKCFGSNSWNLLHLLLLSKLQLRFKEWLKCGIKGTAVNFALEQSPEIDCRSFLWMVGSLDEDDSLEQFFASIPGFFKSTDVEDPENIFWKGLAPSVALLQLMNRTLTSHTLSDSAKQRRIAVCKKAMDVATFPVHFYPLNIAIRDWDEFSCSIDSGLILNASTYGDPAGLNHRQCMISIILARVQARDDRWCELATSHLGVSESVLQNYLAHGDSASLANLNCVIRRAIDFHLSQPWSIFHTNQTVKWVSDFDVQTTLPELQHTFCALWNELVLKLQNSEAHDFTFLFQIMIGICHIYITLHTDTAPASAPAVLFQSPCTIAGHHPDSASHIHEDVVGTTKLPVRTEVTPSPTIPSLGRDTPANMYALASLSLPTPSPDHANFHPTNELSLDYMSAAPRLRASVTAPTPPAFHMTPVNELEDRHSSIAALDPTATSVILTSDSTDLIAHAANSTSRSGVAPSTSTPILSSSSISHSNNTAPLSAVPTTLSLSVFTGNTPLASVSSGLPASTTAGHVTATLVTVASNSGTTSRYTEVGLDVHDEGEK